MNSILIDIINKKKAEVEQLKTQLKNEPNHEINHFISTGSKIYKNKPFKKTLKSKGLSVIAEIKRSSPSKGSLAEIKDPVALATEYVTSGADAVSVLTEKTAFKGSIEDLKAVSKCLKNHFCTVLRKDFIIDPIQITEAATAGADAVLLIVSVLKEKTESFICKAKEIGIDALVEIHDEEELKIAINSGSEIIGINNRNLHSFKVDINNSLRLVKQIPDGIIKIAESGISNFESANKMAKAGFDAVLIGEAIVKAKSPSEFIRKLKMN